MRYFSVEATVDGQPTTSKPKFINPLGYSRNDSIAWFEVKAESASHAAYLVAQYVPQINLEQVFAVSSRSTPESPEFFDYDLDTDTMVVSE